LNGKTGVRKLWLRAGFLTAAPAGKRRVEAMNFFKFLLDHEGAIYLLSAIVSLLFAVVFFSLLRSARILQGKKWVKSLAATFLVLAVIYFLRLTAYICNIDLRQHPLNLINIIIHFCSGVTNYLFFLSGFRLWESALDAQGHLPLKKWLAGRAYVRPASFLILCMASLTGLASATGLAGGWARVPDIIFSALALLFMGFVLYQNSSFSRDKLMAWIALLSSSGYAVLYLLRGFGVIHYLIKLNLPDASDGDILKIAFLFASLISLLLKFGFFFSAYSLMLLISGPVQGIERLLRDITRNQQEYLESNGIVRSICKALQVNRVRLYIKLPGSNENKVVLYDYPSSNNGNKQEPRELIYRPGEVYDQVIKSRSTYSRNHEKSLHWLIPRASKVGVPVLFHNSVIACLEVEIGKENFTEADQSNLERIATLISSDVQVYRERAGLNKITQNTAQLQIGVVAYEIERDVRGITEIIHDVVSPLATGISIEIGFSEYRCIYPENDPFEELIKAQLDAEPDAEETAAHSEDHHWFKKELKVAMVNSQGQKIGEQVFGKFIFATDEEDKEKDPPTLGTNALFLRDISNLLTDKLLDFIRGYLTALTDKLGVRLSGLKGTSAADWLKEVEKTAHEARLLWAVASYPDDDLLGDNPIVEIINRLEGQEQKGKWEKKDEGLWLYSLDEPEAGAYYVIKKYLKETEATLWLGVARRGFGREMDYVSPWKYFLDHFYEIADSALLRIMNKKQEEELRKHMAEFHSMETAAIVTGNVIHRLVNLARSLINPLAALEMAVKESRLQCNEDLKTVILSLRRKRDDFEELIKLFLDARKRDERRPCFLEEAITQALEKVEGSLRTNGIKIKKRTLQGASINVSLHAAINAIVNVVENARDAIINGKVKDGLIRIEVKDEADKFTCDIIDNGSGVPDDVRKRLFKEIINSTRPDSHGIGLYYSAFWLRGYGGDIALARQKPEKGAAFSIHFPK
jgi:signal transduction histidine kinase